MASAESNEDFEEVREVLFDPNASFDAFGGSAPPSEGDGCEAEPEIPRALPAWRQNVVIPTNEAGVQYDPELDQCYHLNASWKGGVCTVQGNQACPLLGGNQRGCPYYVDRETETARRATLPPHERYKLTSIS